MTQQTVLPAKVYDAVKASAEKHGGIGARRFFVGESPHVYVSKNAPCCAVGHLIAAGCVIDPGDARDVIGLTVGENDGAVRTINTRKGMVDKDARVSFEEWAAELGVVRGDS